MLAALLRANQQKEADQQFRGAFNQTPVMAPSSTVDVGGMPAQLQRFQGVESQPNYQLLAQLMGSSNPLLAQKSQNFLAGQKAIQGLQPEYDFMNTPTGTARTTKGGGFSMIPGTQPPPPMSTPRNLREMETGNTKKRPDGVMLKEVVDVDPTTMKPIAGAQPRWVPWQGPERPFVLQTGTGPQIVDRGRGTASPITDESGQPLGLAPTTDMRNRTVAYQKAKPVLGAVSELSEKINTGQGVLAKIRGGVERAKAEANLNDDVAEYNALISGFTPLIARSLGHTGVLTEQDVQSVKELFPKPGDSKSLRDRKVNRILSIFDAIQGESLGQSNNQSGVAAPQTQETRTVGGKTYVKINGEWYEQ